MHYLVKRRKYKEEIVMVKWGPAEFLSKLRPQILFFHALKQMVEPGKISGKTGNPIGSLTCTKRRYSTILLA